MPYPGAGAAPDLAAVLAGRATVCSWSGGKDCTLALDAAVAAGARPVALLTMLTEDGERSRSHGLRRAVLEAQAAALGLPLLTRSASWAGYEEAFVDALRELRAGGVEAGVFGDIDIEGHREWVHRVCARAGIVPVHPLWQLVRREVIGRLTARGIVAHVVAVREEALPRELLGRRVDGALAAELGRIGADLAGEFGEYHSVVVDCPLFSGPLRLAWGDAVLRDGVWFVDACPDTIAL